MSAKRWSDQSMEVIIGQLLRAGVLLAGSVVLIGAVIYLSHHGHELIDYSAFHGEPQGLKSISGIVSGTLHGTGRAIIQLGLLLLIATPIARVAFSAAGFAIERDYMYVVITLIVFAILLYSLFSA